MGWIDAYDHLRATWDYPFEDYSRGGQSADRKRMLSYESTAPDAVRYLPPKAESAFPLPGIEGALNEIDQPAFRRLEPKDKILLVASVAALPTGWMDSRTGGSPHMARTSPSGGARHPSELYLLALNIPGIERGAYHISVGTEDARFLSTLPDDATLRQNLPGAYRLPVAPEAIFVITSHIERNMYRYREPRTLRTIYYDAGHMGGLIEALLDNGSTVSHGHQGFSDTYLVDLLGCESFATESPSYLVSVGSREGLDSSHLVGKSRLNA